MLPWPDCADGLRYNVRGSLCKRLVLSDYNSAESEDYKSKGGMPYKLSYPDGERRASRHRHPFKAHQGGSDPGGLLGSNFSDNAILGDSSASAHRLHRQVVLDWLLQNHS